MEKFAKFVDAVFSAIAGIPFVIMILVFAWLTWNHLNFVVALVLILVPLAILIRWSEHGNDT